MEERKEQKKEKNGKGWTANGKMERDGLQQILFDVRAPQQPFLQQNWLLERKDEMLETN